LSIDSEISMKAPKCKGKLLRRIYLHSNCKEKVEQRKHKKIYVKNPQGKNTVKREILLNQRDYKEFLALYYRFNSLWFNLLQKRKRLTFIAEG